MKTISSRHLGNLPNIKNLYLLLQSLAVLDAIMSPEWGGRYYSFNRDWGELEQMGSMRNGQGDEFFVLFNPSGCLVKGFDHESAMSSWNSTDQKPWKGVLDNVPNDFSSALNQPAFAMDSISFCLWRKNSDEHWSIGPIQFPDKNDPDGSEYLLEILDGNPYRYAAFAQEYYEEKLNIGAITHIYHHLPLTAEIVNLLNPKISLSDLQHDLNQIGYLSKATI
jgi:hypothetical protein